MQSQIEYDIEDDFDFDDELRALFRSAQRKEFGPSTGSLVKSAEERKFLAASQRMVWCSLVTANISNVFRPLLLVKHAISPLKSLVMKTPITFWATVYSAKTANDIQ